MCSLCLQHCGYESVTTFLLSTFVVQLLVVAIPWMTTTTIIKAVEIYYLFIYFQHLLCVRHLTHIWCVFVLFHILVTTDCKIDMIQMEYQQSCFTDEELRLRRIECLPSPPSWVLLISVNILRICLLLPPPLSCTRLPLYLKWTIAAASS